MAHAKTKKVRITLAALTRVEYSEVLEVPANMSDRELQSLVEHRYDNVDGGKYSDDAEYWERSQSCGFEAEPPSCTPDARVRRVTGGSFAVSTISAP